VGQEKRSEKRQVEAAATAGRSGGLAARDAIGPGAPIVVDDRQTQP
jgi:hypothetical protein